MIGRDCRCPGCGTCDAASEVERLRERLAVERTPNGAGKWNAERVLREKAERERDEARVEIERLRVACDGCADSLAKTGSAHYADCPVAVVQTERDELKARLDHAEADAEQAIHNEAFMERQRIVAWIRAKHLMLSSLAIANCIEQGEHEE